MDCKYNLGILVLRCYILVLMCYVLSHDKVEATIRVQKPLAQKHEGTVKTIEVEGGDIIDCIDIYKQPSIKHGFVEDIQMEPSWYPKGMKKTNEARPRLLQDWHRFGKCPHGTIPMIRRTTNNHRSFLRPSTPFTFSGKQFNHNHTLVGSPTIEHQFAAVGAREELFQGAQGGINLWNPNVEGLREFSSSQIRLTNDITVRNQTLNTIEAGWIVYPERYNSTDPRLYIFSTSDKNQLGCYDQDCPGFVQTSYEYLLGGLLFPISEFGKQGKEIRVNIYKEITTGNWWLEINEYPIGYWPERAFRQIKYGASTVLWGGEIVNIPYVGRHTKTQMGSGHFSSLGLTRASYIRNLTVIDTFFDLKYPSNLVQYVSNSKCYDLIYKKREDDVFGDYILYGGPGFSSNCP